MLKIPQKHSVLLSMVMCGVLAAVVAVICVELPKWLRLLLTVFEKPEDLLAPTLAVVYLSAVIAYAAIAMLFVLLINIKRGDVFTERNVNCLRGLSWLCMGAALCYALLSVFYPAIAPIIAFACAFMGVILRVVKNSFEKAVEIKNENDFTV